MGSVAVIMTLKVVQSCEITIKLEPVLAATQVVCCSVNAVHSQCQPLYLIHIISCSVVLYCHRVRSLGKVPRCRPKGRAAPSRPLSMHPGPMCRTIPT